MPAGHHQPRSAEDGRRAQDGADVVRIRHLVENDQRPGFGALGQRGNVGLIQRLGFQQHALMHRVLAQHAIELARRHALGGRLTRADGLGEAVLGVLRHQQPQHLAGVVAQGGFDRVDAVQLHAALIEWAALGALRPRLPSAPAAVPPAIAASRRLRAAVSIRGGWFHGIFGSKQGAHPAAFPFDIQGAGADKASALLPLCAGRFHLEAPAP